MHKVRRIGPLLFSSGFVYCVPLRAAWEEVSLADDAALLRYVDRQLESHIDLKARDGWQCLSANSSRCSVIETQLREAARLADEAAAERKRISREAVIAHAAQAKADAVTAAQALKAAEQAAREAEREAAAV